MYTPPMVQPSPTEQATQSVGCQLSCSAISRATVFLPSVSMGLMPALRLYQPYFSIAALERSKVSLSVAQHRDYLRAEYEKLGQLAFGGAAGYKYYGLEPHARRIARTGGSRIAG